MALWKPSQSLTKKMVILLKPCSFDSIVVLLLESGAPLQRAKKIPGPIIIDQGISQNIHWTSSTPHCPREVCYIVSQGRSSDFRFVLVSRLPVQKTVALLRNSSPVTAAGPSRIYTGFPIKLSSEHLRYVHNIIANFRLKSRDLLAPPDSLYS